MLPAVAWGSIMEYTVLLLAFAWLTGMAFATALVGTWIARSRRSNAGASDGEGRRSVAGQKSERLFSAIVLSESLPPAQPRPGRRCGQDSTRRPRRFR